MLQPACSDAAGQLLICCQEPDVDGKHLESVQSCQTVRGAAASKAHAGQVYGLLGGQLLVRQGCQEGGVRSSTEQDQQRCLTQRLGWAAAAAWVQDCIAQGQL